MSKNILYAGVIGIITYGLIIFLFSLILSINIYYFTRFILGFITILLFTTIFHFALERPIDYIRGKERETLIEHFLFVFLALIIWSIIDYGYYFQSDFLSFLIDKIWFLALTLPIIYFYSLSYRLISNRFTLIFDISGLILAICIASYFELQLYLNRASSNYNFFLTQVIAIIIILTALSILIKLRYRRF